MSGPNTKRSGRQSLGLLPVLALLALALVAAACGGDSATTSSTPSATPGGAASWGPSDLEAIAADPDLKAMLPSGMTEIRVASDIPYPPWEYYVEDTKQPTGFDYDLSQAHRREDRRHGLVQSDALRQHHPVAEGAASTT